jgi:hypothetical protein
MNKYYIVLVFGGVELERLKGPFKTWNGMVRAARKVYANQAEEDAIFWLRTGKRQPSMGSFSRQDLNRDE